MNTALSIEQLTQKYQLAKERFDDFLYINKNRRTPERYAILEEIYVHQHHFDAESLYIRMKQNAYRVSRATIYNTLDILVESGLIKKHHFGENKTLFERSYGFEDHHHIICTNCGKILEFQDPIINYRVDALNDSLDVSPMAYSLNVYGMCKNCSN